VTTLNRKIGTGIVWNVANMLVSRGASVLFTLFLARFLAPEAFGLMAMVAICYAIADALMVSGFGQAIIRQPSITPEDLSTAFFANLALSLLLYPLLYVSAPWVAQYYGHADLTLMLRVIGVVLFINAFKVVQLALMNRDMDFKTLMRVNSTATIVAGVLAVAMAYAGFGVWSLVAQFIAMATVSTVLLWVHSTWRPQLNFSGAALRRMFGFGSMLTIEGVLNVLYENAYILVIGKLFTPEITGLYYFAKRIRDLVVDQVNAAVQQATYPAMAQIQNEADGLRMMYRTILQLLFFVITPCLAVLTLLSEPLFALAFNPRWMPAVPYLQLLCIAGVVFPVHTINLNMLKVKGRSDLVLYVGLVKKGLHLALLAATAPFGIMAILIGQVVAAALSCLPYMYYSHTLLGYRLALQLRDIIKPVFASAVAAALAWGLLLGIDAAPMLAVAAGSACFILTYAIAGQLLSVEGFVLIRNKLLALHARQIKKRAGVQT